MSLCAGVHLPGSVRPRGRPLTAGVTAQPWPRAPAAGSAGWRMSHAALRRHGQDVVVAGRPRSPPSGRTDPPGGIMTSSITPLRISPGVTPDTHPSIATGHSRSKFGLPAGATATDRLILQIGFLLPSRDRIVLDDHETGLLLLLADLAEEP